MLATILCYVFLSFGLYYFIIKRNAPIIDSFILGLIIYAVFELTNKALLRSWTWKTVLLDSLWGGILFIICTLIIKQLIQKLTIE